MFQRLITLIIKELLAYLDAKVGKGRYILTMSADHGVCPLPEVSRTQGKDVTRLTSAKLRSQAGQFLDEAAQPRIRRWRK